MLAERKKNLLGWVLCVIIALALAIAIRYFIGELTVVKKVSMYPTLQQNERLIINRWIKTTHTMPERGDIITFEAPTVDYISQRKKGEDPVAIYQSVNRNIWENFVYYVLEIGKKSYIKRVIALPGEHVEIKSGKVYINGQLLKEEYLPAGMITDNGQGKFFDVVVPEGHVFVMGDNRSESTDSRAFGCIPQERIESKLWIRCWPLNKWGSVE